MNQEEMDPLKKGNPNYGMLDVWYDGDSIRFEDHGSYDNRSL